MRGVRTLGLKKQFPSSKKSRCLQRFSRTSWTGQAALGSSGLGNFAPRSKPSSSVNSPLSESKFTFSIFQGACNPRAAAKRVWVGSMRHLDSSGPHLLEPTQNSEEPKNVLVFLNAHHPISQNSHLIDLVTADLQYRQGTSRGQFARCIWLWKEAISLREVPADRTYIRQASLPCGWQSHRRLCLGEAALHP